MLPRLKNVRCVLKTVRERSTLKREKGDNEDSVSWAFVNISYKNRF